LTYVAPSIVEDVFQGTGKIHKDVIKAIQETRRSQSFQTQKRMTIKNVTEHHPDGIARNVLGYIEGSDPSLKDEFVVIGAHLDHLGYNHEMMPGANDNASGVAVALGVAEALSKVPTKPRRSVLFAFFGAEEQGVRGSEYYLEHPFVAKDKTFGLINLDGVGRGEKIRALAGKRYPELWQFIDDANKSYVHRDVVPTDFHNLARPRLDAAHFMWADIPSLSFGAFGAEELPRAVYHKTYDSPEIITPEIMEDLGRIIFIAVMGM
jgi:Zn-dependent M28 family amino/carboxypeptidase